MPPARPRRTHRPASVDERAFAEGRKGGGGVSRSNPGHPIQNDKMANSTERHGSWESSLLPCPLQSAYREPSLWVISHDGLRTAPTRDPQTPDLLPPPPYRAYGQQNQNALTRAQQEYALPTTNESAVAEERHRMHHMPTGGLGSWTPSSVKNVWSGSPGFFFFQYMNWVLWV